MPPCILQNNKHLNLHKISKETPVMHSYFYSKTAGPGLKLRYIKDCIAQVFLWIVKFQKSFFMEDFHAASWIPCSKLRRKTKINAFNLLKIIRKYIRGVFLWLLWNVSGILFGRTPPAFVSDFVVGTEQVFFIWVNWNCFFNISKKENVWKSLAEKFIISKV